MKINPEMSVFDVQNAFTTLFPGLKLEMYSQAHEHGEISSNKDILKGNVKLSELNPDLGNADFEVSEDMTVAELEQQFSEKFKLNVQVYRRSNNIWLQTSTTDDWTLAVQNRKGLHSVQNS